MEIEKSVGGVLSSNKSDGGTSSAMFGKLLTWMQESKKPKFIVATCNDIQPLLEASHGALIRRFDDVFFVDTPSESEKAEILAIHNAKYAADIPANLTHKMQDWTGAEIEKLCKSSRFEGVEKAFANIRPIYEQNKELFTKMRAWAGHNARPANRIEARPEKISAAARKLAI
jgi:SpoVK/Ycf46/Vps4 family AAA+-type ATPase